MFEVDTKLKRAGREWQDFGDTEFSLIDRTFFGDRRIARIADKNNECRTVIDFPETHSVKQIQEWFDAFYAGFAYAKAQSEKKNRAYTNLEFFKNTESGDAI